ncbi:flagellar basal body-associated protein FliL [Edwardsiella piscicida]|uniref:Flagellar protein FliL n=4 Tax=Edwardsiella TaxID=635 RepID=A0A0H3DRR2_EDWTF|nr:MULTISPECIES: flagellar basal body-associated protein FliL [Edwardsiella]ACY84983.1 flagellar basal body-associated protein [Edwardsiella tarda EIB202]ADM42046.1 Flagellar biosynthesis protein FliL [Edwardsiella tarda FL6-60]AKM47554.1 flagellar basal body-associated protein FliL [Edwardsiella sp. EA181011]AGH74158.1 flagellar basal body-associated protein FliL [Edwardsiella piscicida C07-087]AKR78143.1 flagellar basal body-associated protein FliL [Edwardsiella sp. LADL05-105]
MSDMSLPNRSAKRRKWVLILLVLFAALAAGGGYFGWHYYQQTQQHTVKQAPIPLPVFMALDPFTVNLLSNGDDSDRVLYVGITLRLPDEGTRKRLNDYLPEVRSRLLMLLSRQQAATLASEQGKKALMDEIKSTLRAPVVSGQPAQMVNDVMFTAFILR